MPNQGLLEKDSHLARSVRALGTGLALTLAQIAFACFMGNWATGVVNFAPSELAKSYGKLLGGDAVWYESIADGSYNTDKEIRGKRGNAAFFPAYPLLARGLARTTGLAIPLCLLLVSQIACWGFWTYFLLVLDRHDVSIAHSRLFALIVISQPAAFFLVTGTSESLFLMAMLGYFFWTDMDQPALKWIGALHGLLMTATQALGLLLAVYPILRGALRPSSENRIEGVLDGMLLASLASLGGIAFFGYCHYTFGAWDLYISARETAWQARPNYVAIFDPDTYILDLELWQTDGILSPDWLSRVLVPAFFVLLVVIFGIEMTIALTLPNSSWKERFAYYLLALSVFYASTVVLFDGQYRSMVRSLLCVEVLLAAQFAHMLANEDLEVGDWLTMLLAAILIVPAFVVQGALLYRFMTGGWVG